jgi:hypothetical protein
LGAAGESFGDLPRDALKLFAVTLWDARRSRAQEDDQADAGSGLGFAPDKLLVIARIAVL